jgi:outer membrane protein OmpA-like peptidoglycan-associated protein
VAVVAALVGLFYRQLKRMESQINSLSEQTEQINSRLAQVEQRTQTAAQQANQAAQSARAAAAQRDQAEEARAQAVTQAQQAEQQASAAKQQAEEYRRQREEELTHLQQALGQIAETRRTAMGLVMTLGSESVRFDFDRSDIKPQYRETLSRIAGVLSTVKGYSIYVYGYTDDVGSQEYNLGLSERRADAVRNYLVSSGIDPKILTIKGFGKSNPRVPGDTPQARAKNRRVEIGIVDSTLRVEGIVPPAR